MRLAIAGLLLCALAGGVSGQEPRHDEIDACEQRLLAGLLSPSSYKRIEVVAREGTVWISYDASNVYGAILRQEHTCLFVNTSDGRRFADDPVITLEASMNQCTAELRGKLERGVLSKRHYDLFSKDCEMAEAGKVLAFQSEIAKANIAYPLEP